jgi:hypothetical protein
MTDGLERFQNRSIFVIGRAAETTTEPRIRGSLHRLSIVAS